MDHDGSYCPYLLNYSDNICYEILKAYGSTILNILSPVTSLQGIKITRWHETSITWRAMI
ncbi:hypothetical protein M6B38_359845 [Iris pallida]|uniref:Uncharacterized protein n=1 Tax=Iris pallida TaxID=29817 RepID=A0AAX6GLK0_IRIPA|nr:hypothetical protein M6B38_359845 [Iris pallida]